MGVEAFHFLGPLYLSLHSGAVRILHPTYPEFRRAPRASVAPGFEASAHDIDGRVSGSRVGPGVGWTTWVTSGTMHAKGQASSLLVLAEIARLSSFLVARQTDPPP